MATKIVAAVAGSSPGARPVRATRRVVLLGASNLTNGFGAAVRRLRAMFPEPLEIVAAYGHGRSYGTRSVVMGRMLPGIEGCGLWTALAARPPLPTVALITDIGNDILYDADLDAIAGWVAACVQRLTDYDARIAITELPVVNLARLRPWPYLALRSFLFPKCRLSLDEVSARARGLNDHVHRLAAEHRLALVAQNSAWYGLDPIHVLREHERAAWRAFLRPLAQQVPSAGSPDTMPTLERRPSRSGKGTISGYALAPEQRWLFGREQRRRQPSCRWPDGTSFSIY